MTTKKQLALAALFGLIAALAFAAPSSAVPSQLRFTFVEVIQRSSTRAAVLAEQRGAGPEIELRGTDAARNINSDAPVHFNRLIVVPYGTNAGIVTMTPTLTSTPTITPSPTLTRTPTPTP